MLSSQAVVRMKGSPCGFWHSIFLSGLGIGGGGAAGPQKNLKACVKKLIVCSKAVFMGSGGEATLK